jgi:lipopolysaccharide biosynthesis protein
MKKTSTHENKSDLYMSLLKDKFDKVYYLHQRQNIEIEPLDDLFEDYLTVGIENSLSPNSWFDVCNYYNIRPDVKKAGIEPFIHFMRYGLDERVDLYSTDISSFEDGQNIISAPYRNFESLTTKSFDINYVAFYLPQFHEIPENNEWWGKGFTEWTNVKRAKPQFEDHYQPHKPIDIGYYDLTSDNIMIQQSNLAQNYGIDAFCFYFYWFDGKILLDKPIKNFANNDKINTKFCLCWANENWTRSWDGLDHDILIEQKYTKSNALEFIKSIKIYLDNKKYLTFNGRPVLLVYRPSSIPDIKSYVKVWRNFCKNNNISDPYLVSTSSFISKNPNDYNFDAEVEFPPNNSNPPRTKIKSISKKFQGQIFDWNNFVEKSKNYTTPGYELIRGVNCGWDNSARKGLDANIFYGSSPEGYQEWLLNASKDTISRKNSNEESFVFINAWNEWAEGAHLEPDTKYHYSYLQATLMSKIRCQSKKITSKNLGVIIHVFYIDTFESILKKLLKYRENAKFYITTDTQEKKAFIQGLCDKFNLSFIIKVYENRGRDVLPFIKIMNECVLGDEVQYILKVHTKKSLHRSDGHIWLNEALNSLCSLNYKEIMIRFQNPKIGIIAPDNCLISIKSYFASNKNKILDIATQIGVNPLNVEKLNFSAGTLFFADINALIPILKLLDDSRNFEKEGGQVDGTMAHAVERLFSISAYSMGMETVAIETNRNLDQQEFAYAKKTS